MALDKTLWKILGFADGLASAVDADHVLGLCNSLHDILSSVTSARISKVEINFKINWVTYDVAIKRLCEGEDGLTRIDAILSTPVFGALAEVVISYSYDMQRAKIGIPAMQTPAMHSYPTP